MIKQGDLIPSVKLMAANEEGPRELSTDDVFRGKRVVLFGLPGAFTPTCSAQHLPGYNHNLDAIKARGIDTVACMAVNDVFVMTAWAKNEQVSPEILMLADGSAQLTQALGLQLDLTQRGLGIRCQRFALVADDMRVTYLAVEQPGDFDVSRAEAVLARL